LNILSDGHSDSYSRGPGLAFRAVLLSVLSAGLMIYDANDTALRPLRSVISQALTPIVWLASGPQHLRDLGSYARTRSDLAEENQALRTRQLELDLQVQKLEAVQTENRRLRQLLLASETLPDHELVADIIEISQDPYRHQIVLNKGSHDGVFVGQAMLDAYGVLGQVIEAQAGRSIGLLLTDAQHGMPVELNRTGLQTIAQGEGDGQSLRLPFLPGNADVVVGDLIVSSSLGGRFPAGYPVGRVSEIRHHAGDLFKEAVAYPVAHLNQGRQVLLLSRPAGAEAEAAPADGEAAATAAGAKP
jgi:rod shape-determining protein MreC